MDKAHCQNCAHYCQHYGLKAKEIYRLYCGHCMLHPRLKKRPDALACTDFKSGEPDPDAFVSKEYLSKELLHYMMQLELLPEIRQSPDPADCVFSIPVVQWAKRKEVPGMRKCVIFCAAEFDALEAPIREGDLVIAADGGLMHTEALGIRPDVILGDFDSLGYVPEGSRVFPVRKDDTDLMLALRHGLDAGYREFTVYGAMDGPRPDHTVANLQALVFLEERGAHGQLVGKTYIATALRNGTIRFPAGKEGILSVFCMGADCHGVELAGLSYPMENGTLRAGFPLGVSNHFTGEAARVAVRKGTLVCLWERKAGLCHREEKLC